MTVSWMVCLFNRSGRPPGGAYHPGVQQGRLPGADGVSGRLRQAHQHRHGQGGCESDGRKDGEEGLFVG